MIASKIGTDDILNIGTDGKLEAVLPNYSAIKSVKSLVTRAKKRYPRKDGMTYAFKSERETNTVTIKVVKQEKNEKSNNNQT